MEEKLNRWRLLEVTCGGRYGGKCGGVWREKFQVLVSNYFRKVLFWLWYHSGRIVKIGEKVEERWRNVYGGGGKWRGYVEGDMEETFREKNMKKCHVLVSHYFRKVILYLQMFLLFPPYLPPHVASTFLHIGKVSSIFPPPSLHFWPSYLPSLIVKIVIL